MEDPEIHHDGIELAVVEREPLGVASPEIDFGAPRARDRDHFRRKINAGRDRAARRRRLGHKPRAAGDIQHAHPASTAGGIKKAWNEPCGQTRPGVLKLSGDALPAVKLEE